MMTDEERYLFDLQGYMVIEDVLKLDEYDLWNETPGHDNFFDFWKNGDGQISAGPLHRFAKPFRQLVAHPRIVPYLADLLGNQFRSD